MRLSNAAARRRATIGGAISMTIAIFLINAPFVAAQALRLLVAGWFAVDAVRYAIGMFRRTDRTERTLAALAALGNTALALLLLFARGSAEAWVVAVAGAARILGIAWNIATAPVYTTADAEDTVVRELGLSGEPEAVALAAEVEAAERGRAPADRGWTIAFILTLFAIHIGRMRTDLTVLGLLSPAIAVLGDMALAVLIALLVINPLYLLWRGPTRWIERRVWQRYVRSDRDGGHRLDDARRGRVAALEDAVCHSDARGPVFAAGGAEPGAPDRPASCRDCHGNRSGVGHELVLRHRELGRRGVEFVGGVAHGHMAGSHGPRGAGGGGRARRRACRSPSNPRASLARDFSFVVIGDPGEGDASQHVLRDQLLTVAAGADVRFVVVSSDVVYPSGSMNDYEAKFWLPFKGITRPVYAIPGNHDWYDALEAFAATFLQPEAARASIRARVEADLRVTSTTDARIEHLIDEAERLRQAYGVPTGFQRAPFFEIQTDRFALVAIDTGVLQSIDPAQADGSRARSSDRPASSRWRSSAIRSSRVATTDLGRRAFAGLKQLLLRHGVTILMAGDKHDLEYYARAGRCPPTPVHYFVNGGGGAYLSLGTALAWPAQPPTADWAYYPTRDAVAGKIEARPPGGSGRPGGGRSISTRGRSAPSGCRPRSTTTSRRSSRASSRSRWNRPRIACASSRDGVHGRLTWGDLASSQSLRTASGNDRALVEWVVPMRAVTLPR